MKKSQFFMLLISAMMAFAALAFTSCVDDNDDKGLPYLEVSPETLSFDAAGKAVAGSDIVIKTNRPWRVTFEKDVTWVRLSATEGKGSATLSVSVPEFNGGRQTKVTIATYNSYGNLITKTVTVSQGEVKPVELIFKETFGTTGGSAIPYPTVADYTGWDKSGVGSSTVTYSGENAQLRNSSPSDNNFSGYPGSGGTNLYFSNKPNNFIVNDITIPEGDMAFTLTFGAYIYNPASADPYYTTYTVELSKDGQKWVKIPFDITFVAEKSWNLATANFQVKEYTSKLYIKFSAVDGNNRIDDVILNTGNGGTLVDLENGSTSISVTTSTPPQVSATSATLSGAVSSTEGVTAVGFQYTANAASIDWTAVAKTPVTPVAAAFTKDVTGLATGITYAVRAYATSAAGDTYGNVVTFKAEAASDATIAIDFSNVSSYPTGFPTAKGTYQPAVYKFGGYDFTFAGTSDTGYYQSYYGEDKFLLFGKTGAYIEFPAIAGKSLAKVTATTRDGASKSVVIGIYNASNQAVTGGEAVKWDSSDFEYTYTLSGTEVNTKYRLYVTNAYNAQLTKLELWYKDGGSEPVPTVSLNPTSLNFTSAADNTGKTVAATVANATGLTLFAVSSDNTQFPTTLSGNTITVKALANTTTQQKTATVTVYLAATQSGERKATATVTVTQDQQAPTTVTSIADVISGGADKLVLVEGQIVGVTTQSFVVKDDTGLLYVYMGAAPSNQVGDKVKVLGTTDLYGNIIQIGKDGIVVTPVSTGSYTQPSPEMFNGAAIDSYVNGTAPLPVKYVQYAGTLTVSGNFYNVTVDGTSVKGSLLYAPTSLVDASWNNKKIVVSGYVAGTPNTNKNFMNTVAVTITEDTSGGPDISSITPASLTWAATATDAKTLTVNGTNLSGITLTATSSATNSAFTFAVNGTSVTVTPKAANTGTADISETLTIAAPGGNSKTVALTQSKPSTGGFTGLLAKWIFANNTDFNATEGNTTSVISRVGVSTAISYTPSSTSIWCNGWDGADVTPKYWLLTIPHTSALSAGSKLKVEWGAWGTATSPKNWDIEYSTDNTSWTKIASEVYTDVNKATHALTSAAFASEIAAGTIYVRFKVNGTVPIGADKTAVESTGNSRMANVAVTIE